MLRTDNTITLRDGRRLGYSEFGDPKGFPVLYFHGIPGSRLQRPVDLDFLDRRRVHVFGLERPGIGLSDYQEDRRIENWPADVARFMEQRGIKSCGIVGVSGGGPYALSCALAYPERVRELFLISSMVPLNISSNWESFSPEMRLVFRAAQRFPKTLSGFLNLLKPMVDLRVEQIFMRMTGRLPEEDLRILSDPNVAAMFKSDIREAIRQGGDGIVAELRALMNPWELPLGELRVPVRIWHGSEDTIVPLEAGRYLACRIPNARFSVVNRGGHFIALEIIEKVLVSDP